MHDPSDVYDVIIVGGGPAGTSAALILGRSRRRVLVCDAGHPRNGDALAMHGFITREETPPRELLRMAREETARYGVVFVDGLVTDARCLAAEPAGQSGTFFEVLLRDGRTLRCRKLLLATGVADVLPEVEGVRRFYGKSVHHCPYCDGWEHRDESIASYGPDGKGAGLALSLRNWSKRVTACTDGSELDPEYRGRLDRCGIAIREERVLRVEGTGDRLERVVFASGPVLECSAMFFNTEHVQRSDLPVRLGCEYDEKGHVVTSHRQRTPMPGLFLAGDADGDVQFVIVAAAEGATAAVAINKELQEEDRGEARARPFSPK